MILDAIINIIDAVLDVLLAPITFVSLGFSNVNLKPLEEALQVVCYVMPIGLLTPLIIAIFAIGVLRITIALVHFVKGFIPFIS